MLNTGDDVFGSLEFRYAIDRAVAARQAGRADVADIFIRTAERLFGAALPDLAREVSMIASRKGAGRTVAGSLAGRMSPTSAAALMIIWTLRGARRTALQRLTEAFGGDEAFSHALKALCPRLRL